MELKLVDSKPLSNEIIDSFYQRLEQQQLDAERQEELEYNESGIITRRKFLQYSALGAVGLGLGFSTEEAEAHPFLALLPVGFWLAREIYRSYQPLCGTVVIRNETKLGKSGRMVMNIKKTRSIRHTVSDSATYYVPAESERTFEFSNGAYAIARRDTNAKVTLSNKRGSDNTSFHLLA